MTTVIPLVVMEGSDPGPALCHPADFPQQKTPPASGFYLIREHGALRLRDGAAGALDKGMSVDLNDRAVEARLAGGRRSALAKAIGLPRHPHTRVLDTTCGLARDCVTLAGLGARVHALERHPVLYELVADARARATAGSTTPPPWAASWQNYERTDARTRLDTSTPGEFDVIYIDPMFDSPRRKAAPQKALAWMHALIGTDDDASGLLEIARRHAARQTVVKQHARAAPLAPPDRQVLAKAVRFDIYLSRWAQHPE